MRLRPVAPLLLAAAITMSLAGVQAANAWVGLPPPYSPHYRYPSVVDAPNGYGARPVYGFAGPSYRWGWFGVQYRPRSVHYTGANLDYWQSGFRWGY